jgi:hypothetical protein
MCDTLKTLCVAIIITIAVNVMSCDNSSIPVIDGKDTIADNSYGLIPLRIGNKWYYSLYYYDTTGTQWPTIHVDSVVVSRDSIIGHERWYKAIGLKGPDIDNWDWYTNRTNGLWVLRKVVLNDPPIDTAYQYLTFKYPTAKGESWGGIFGDSTHVLSTNELVDTPLGRDTCIHYEDHYQEASLGDMHYYIVPGNGWVMLEEFSTTNSGRLYVVCRAIVTNRVIIK